MKKINKKILIATPIDNQLLFKIENMFEIVIYRPEIKYLKAINVFGTILPDIIFVNPNKQDYKLNESVLKHTKNLKTIITASTGTHHIDLKYCKKNNIEVISLTKEIETLEMITSTAEHAFFLMGSLIRNIPKSIESVKRYEWNYEPFKGRQLNRMSIGIVGVGRLGKMMVDYCMAFNMDVHVYDPYVNLKQYKFLGTKTHDTLESLYKSVNIISIHIHLNEETKNLFNTYLFHKSNDKYIINTSRGAIVNEIDIIESLKSGHIKGYATDVLTDELGNIKNSNLIKASKNNNIIITPHLGGSTSDAMNIAYNKVLNIYKEKI